MDRPAGLRAAKGMHADGKDAGGVQRRASQWETAAKWGAGKKSVGLKLSIGAVTAALNSRNNAGSEYPGKFTAKRSQRAHVGGYNSVVSGLTEKMTTDEN